MHKDDLKTGMLVQTRDKEIYLLVNGIFIGAGLGFITQIEYQDDLTRGDTYEQFDIIKVSVVLDNWNLQYNHWTVETIDKYLLWSKDSGFKGFETKAKIPRNESFDIETNTWTETKETS